MSSKQKVFVAMSGGVDSSTAAALLKEKGYDCTGLFMITHDLAQSAHTDSQRVCDRLGIKLIVLDMRKDFEGIIDSFCAEYRQGRTPNPCVLCNRMIKFGVLWNYAKSEGADFIATGHYVQLIKQAEEVCLYEASDPSKDQSYVLSMIDRNVLKHILLPLGTYSKKRIREIASQLNLGIEDKPDSQEICFIPDDNYIALLESRLAGPGTPGQVVDSNAKVIGQHEGIHRYTIGQRRGLKIALGQPAYVTKINASDNTITLGSKSDLLSRKLLAGSVNWLTDPPVDQFAAKVKIRYNHSGQPAMVYPHPGTDEVTVEFDEPASAVTPGQAVVFYRAKNDKWQLLGGGWIDKAIKE